MATAAKHDEHDDHHGHGHHEHLAHHFFDLSQQHESLKFGMWLFLVTEILLFGGLFCFYAIYRAWYPEMFIDAHKQLNVLMGGVNTLVLITSSLTVALAIRACQKNNAKQAATLLIVTIACAGIFLVIKYFEYSHKFHLGLLPGKFFSPAEGVIIHGTDPQIFFSIYFTMTGLHGLHVIFGIIFLSYCTYNCLKGKYSDQYYTPIECGGLYWHLVDLIWIYLFPLLYLIG